MCAFWDEKEPKKRTRLSKTAQYALKRVTGNACIVCGKSEKEVGKLVYAHIVKPQKDGGDLKVPMCRNCHGKHDDGLLTAREWKKLYPTKEAYQRAILSKPKKKKDWRDEVLGL